MGSMNEILELAGQLWDRAVVSPPSISKPDQSTSGESIAKDLDLALRAVSTTTYACFLVRIYLTLCSSMLYNVL